MVTKSLTWGWGMTYWIRTLALQTSGSEFKSSVTYIKKLSKTVAPDTGVQRRAILRAPRPASFAEMVILWLSGRACPKAVGWTMMNEHLECWSSLTDRHHLHTLDVHVPSPQTPNTTHTHTQKTHNPLFIYKLEATALCSRMTVSINVVIIKQNVC